MKALTEPQVARYRHDGFLFPFPALDEAERARCLAGLERYETGWARRCRRPTSNGARSRMPCCRGTPTSSAIRASWTWSRT